MTYQELKDAIQEIRSLREAINEFRESVNTLSVAVAYLGDQIKNFSGYVEPSEPAKELPILDSPLEEIGIVTRASNALYRFGIRTVGDLCDMTYRDILKVPKLGKTSIDKSILPSLSKYGLSLREEGDV